jgi:hypothetical protein
VAVPVASAYPTGWQELVAGGGDPASPGAGADAVNVAFRVATVQEVSPEDLAYVVLWAAYQYLLKKSEVRWSERAGPAGLPEAFVDLDALSEDQQALLPKLRAQPVHIPSGPDPSWVQVNLAIPQAMASKLPQALLCAGGLLQMGHGIEATALIGNGQHCRLVRLHGVPSGVPPSALQAFLHGQFVARALQFDTLSVGRTKAAVGGVDAFTTSYDAVVLCPNGATPPAGVRLLADGPPAALQLLNPVPTMQAGQVRQLAAALLHGARQRESAHAQETRKKLRVAAAAAAQQPPADAPADARGPAARADGDAPGAAPAPDATAAAAHAAAAAAPDGAGAAVLGGPPSGASPGGAGGGGGVGGPAAPAAPAAAPGPGPSAGGGGAAAPQPATPEGGVPVAAAPEAAGPHGGLDDDGDALMRPAAVTGLKRPAPEGARAADAGGPGAGDDPPPGPRTRSTTGEAAAGGLAAPSATA